VLVSIPYATALTLVVLAQTTKYSVAFSTKPVRSNTEFAGIVTPYSNHSEPPGVALLAWASLTVTEVAFLLQIDTLAIVNVLAATGPYNVVFVVAERSCAPNLPVAII
jgi:hypothetical protein